MRYSLFGQKPETSQWRWGEARSLLAIDNYREMLEELVKPESKIAQEEIDNWYKKKIDETGEEIDLLRLSSNNKPEHYVPPTDTKLASTLWSDIKPNGSSQLKALFGKKVFENPKSVDFVKRVIRFIEGKSEDILVLDSFAGSGTTAQAVLDLNKEDGGRRKFILVQMTEATPAKPEKNICKDITRERVKRAIDKYSYESGFTYQRVGPAMDAETMLAGQLPEVKQFSHYVFYLCTGEQTTAPIKALDKNLYLVGESGSAGVYLIYSPDYDTLTRLALNLDAAEKILADDGKKRRIVYAPACFLDEEYLRAQNLEFVSIPYGLFQRKGSEA
jgi:adenine-specific DNA-methyltransferase